jgi:type IV secretory pathway TrbD component
MTALRHTPLHRALHRPNLFLGGERELVLITAIICGGVAISALNFVAIAIGAGVWIIVIGLLRMMAKADPQMSRIYLRHIGYRAYYAPRSRPARGAR